MICLVLSSDGELALTMAVKRAEELKNVVRVPEEWDKETLLIRLSTLPLFGTSNTYLHQDDELFEGKPCLADRLLDLLEREKCCHNLVICSTKKKKHPLVKAVKEQGNLIELETKRGGNAGEAMQEILDAALTKAHASMDRDAKRELLTRVGDNAQRLSQEVNKLAAYAGGEVIQKDHVISLVADDSLEDFGLQNALRKRRNQDLSHCIARLLEHGVAPQAIFAQTINEFRRMLILANLVPEDKRSLSRNQFIYELHPNLKEMKKRVAALDESLSRNWHNPYYLYYLYAAVQNYDLPLLRKIICTLGRLHISSRQKLSQEDLMTSITLLVGGKHAEY